LIAPTFSAASLQTLTGALPLIGLGLAACWLDWRHRRIPNWLCGVLFVIGLVMAAVAGGSATLVQHLIHSLAALVAGMILFRFGVFGGGDAKFYAAVAAWFPLAMWARLAIYVALAGLALLVVWFVYRRLTGKKIRPQNPTIYDSLPYGFAIAFGAFAALLA
jgi:prepilin peptidase CpaA